MTVPFTTSRRRRTIMARAQRSDAARNRVRILDAALVQLAIDGVSVPVDRIAAAAGVGPGTLYRHFPTKNDLIAAVVDHRVDSIVNEARTALAEREAGEALFVVLDRLAATADSDQVFADVVATSDPELAASTASATSRFMTVLEDLLADAHAAGAVRADVDVATLKMILSGYQTMALQSADRPEHAARLAEFVRAGLRPTPAE